MLPGPVQARLRASAAQPIEPSRAPSENTVALATECSKPDPMKASRPHHRTASLAPSERVRAAIHSARHTSALHSTARQKSWVPLAASLAAVIEPTRPAPGPARVPPPWTIAANATDPPRLPTRDATHTRA